MFSEALKFMDTYNYSYAKPEEAKHVFYLFYQAFIKKFQSMLPEKPENGFFLYYEYVYGNLNNYTAIKY